MGTILVIEDEQNIRRSIELSHQKEGYIVKTAGSVKEAEKIMKVFIPEVFLCDINLPDGNGLDFIKGIRSQTNAHLIQLFNDQKTRCKKQTYAR